MICFNFLETKNSVSNILRISRELWYILYLHSFLFENYGLIKKLDFRYFIISTFPFFNTCVLGAFPNKCSKLFKLFICRKFNSILLHFLQTNSTYWLCCEVIFVSFERFHNAVEKLITIYSKTTGVFRIGRTNVHFERQFYK